MKIYNWITLKKSNEPDNSEANRNCIGEFRGIRPRMYIEGLLWSSDAETLASQKPRRYNEKFDCSETNDLYNIQQDPISEVYV